MSTSTLAGRPINGSVSHYSSRSTPEQWPIEKFIELLDAAFAYPEVESFRWHQYTPYFNDGDACEFSLGELRVKVTDGDDEGGDYEDGYIDLYGDMREFPNGYWNTHAYPQTRYRDEFGNYLSYDQRVQYQPEGKLPVDDKDRVPVFGEKHDEIVVVLKELYSSFNRFELELHKKLGDPAEVTATREGFDVEHYDHE